MKHKAECFIRGGGMTLRQIACSDSRGWAVTAGRSHQAITTCIYCDGLIADCHLEKPMRITTP